MYNWAVDFRVLRVLPGFPEQIRIAMETQFSDSYYYKAGDYDGLFVYTCAGHGCFRKGDKEWDLYPGTAYVISGKADNISYYYPQGETGSWSFMWLVFKGRHFAGVLQELIAWYGHIYRINQNHPFLEEMRCYQHSGHSSKIISQHQALKLVSDLIGTLSEVFERPSASVQSEKFIDKVQRFMIDNLESGVTPGDVARKFRCSREHLSRLFRAETGVTPAEFIRQRRLQLAAHLLKETRLSIKEIAARTGYEKSTNFVRAFKSLYSMTPLRFRRDGILPLI